MNAGNFSLYEHLDRQRRWSRNTFGPGQRAKGIIDHIRKELLEIEQDPTDLREWIDVVILALDGAWRSGFAPDQIIAALQAKQAKNEVREWPDWRKSDPDKAIEHKRLVAVVTDDGFLGSKLGPGKQEQAISSITIDNPGSGYTGPPLPPGQTISTDDPARLLVKPLLGFGPAKGGSND